MVEKIKLTFLGTGSAIPTARRNHPAMLLQYKAENILIDCGEGTQRQFRKAKLNPCKITKILISHWHSDHILGLPGLLQTLNLNGYNGDLIIYGPKGSKTEFKEKISPYLGFYWNISKRQGNKFNILVQEVNEGIIFEDNDFYIETAEMDHGCPVVAYSFVIKEKNRLDKVKLAKLKLPNSPLIGELIKGKTVEINGKKINGKKLMYAELSKKITFIMDTKINDSAINFTKGADILISEATHSADEQEIAEKYGHLTSVDAANIAKKAKAKKLALIHLSQRYDMIPKIILNEAKTIFSNVIIPEDLESLEV
ncbi:MAG: ribonuclease Z [archaeon]